MRSVANNAKPIPLNSAERRQIEADKTSRLRALRLAKEAEDREAAARIAASDPPRAVRRRVRPAVNAVKLETA